MHGQIETGKNDSQISELFFQGWQVSFHRFSDGIQIHAEVIVDELVAHPGHQPPGYLGVL
jgi:hypothetical protein